MREISSREDLSFVAFLKNSLILSSSITIITLSSPRSAGTHWPSCASPLREVLFVLVLGALMIPDQLHLVPIYLMMVDFPLTAVSRTRRSRGMSSSGATARSRQPFPHPAGTS